jgi:hypothetical protein
MHRGKLKRACGTPSDPVAAWHMAAWHTVTPCPATPPAGDRTSTVSDTTGPILRSGPATPEYDDECNEERDVEQGKRSAQHVGAPVVRVRIAADLLARASCTVGDAARDKVGRALVTFTSVGPRSLERHPYTSGLRSA